MLSAHFARLCRGTHMPGHQPARAIVAAAPCVSGSRTNCPLTTQLWPQLSPDRPSVAPIVP